jgi:hypothetical protein
MLSEYGSHDDPASAARTGGCATCRPPLRTRLPKLKAVVAFDRLATPVPGDPCAWLADSSPGARAGFAAAGDDPYLNQPHE